MMLFTYAHVFPIPDITMLFTYAHVFPIPDITTCIQDIGTPLLAQKNTLDLLSEKQHFFYFGHSMKCAPSEVSARLH